MKNVHHLLHGCVSTILVLCAFLCIAFAKQAVAKTEEDPYQGRLISYDYAIRPSHFRDSFWHSFLVEERVNTVFGLPYYGVTDPEEVQSIVERPEEWCMLWLRFEVEGLPPHEEEWIDGTPYRFLLSDFQISNNNELQLYTPGVGYIVYPEDLSDSSGMHLNPKCFVFAPLHINNRTEEEIQSLLSSATITCKLVNKGKDESIPLTIQTSQAVQEQYYYEGGYTVTFDEYRAVPHNSYESYEAWLKNPLKLESVLKQVPEAVRKHFADNPSKYSLYTLHGKHTNVMPWYIYELIVEINPQSDVVWAYYNYVGSSARNLMYHGTASFDPPLQILVKTDGMTQEEITKLFQHLPIRLQFATEYSADWGGPFGESGPLFYVYADMKNIKFNESGD